MEDDEARSLLREIHEHQIDDAVIYRHRWEPMAVVWDNRVCCTGRPAVTKATTACCDGRRSFAERRQRSQLFGIARSHQLPNRFQKIRIRRVRCGGHDGDERVELKCESRAAIVGVLNPELQPGRSEQSEAQGVAAVEVLEVRYSSWRISPSTPAKLMKGPVWVL